MAHAVGRLIFARDGENFFAQGGDFFTDLLEALLGKATGDTGDAAVVARKAIVDFRIDFEILEVVLAENRRTHARRGRNDRLVTAYLPSSPMAINPASTR